MGQFVKARLVRHWIDGVDRNAALSGKAQAITVCAIKGSFLDVQGSQGLILGPAGDGLLGEVLAFCLAQYKPVRLVHKTRFHDIVGLLGLCRVRRALRQWLKSKRVALKPSAARKGGRAKR